ncbi:hypothetical protein D5S18_04615 [Nocardia panacis]|uniref:MCE family protein n=1 Tax=Nocardia panacis TaxID=2340916 RepID=A0A3A4KUN7_9NOCA|nr:hypothetical protein [Nocardia panacis]RJO78811.1 hypothetical protein D5S18_04615 [Nocardia panacis]
MIGKRTRWGLLAILVTTGTIAAGVAACGRDTATPTGIALVNADTGPTGAKVVQALQDSGGYEWTAAKPGEVDIKDYAAIITLPEDLTTAIGTLAGPDPKRARVTVATHGGADRNLVDHAVSEVGHRIGAVGVDAALSAATQARGQLSQVQFTTQLLGAGVKAAAAGADQFSSGADQLRGFLDSAKSGAAQLTSAVELLNSTIGGAAAQADQLAGALASTGVTVAQVSQTADTVTTGLDQVLPLLRALPFATDPQVVEIIAKLQGLRNISSQAGEQLTGVGRLTGAAVDPNTDLGTLLRTVVGKLQSASTQLQQGAELAKSIPRLADQGGAQLTSAIEQLTGGVSQLQRIVGMLGEQTDKAMAALPPRSGTQQSAIALALTDPVDIVRD